MTITSKRSSVPGFVLSGTIQLFLLYYSKVTELATREAIITSENAHLNFSIVLSVADPGFGQGGGQKFSRDLADVVKRANIGRGPGP